MVHTIMQGLMPVYNSGNSAYSWCTLNMSIDKKEGFCGLGAAVYARVKIQSKQEQKEPDNQSLQTKAWKSEPEQQA